MSQICRFTIPASRDVEQIMDAMAEYGSFDTSEKFLQDLNRICQKIAQFPYMGRSRAELGKGLRSFPAGRYLVFYQVMPDGVEVTRVVSGYQDLTFLFSESPDNPS